MKRIRRWLDDLLGQWNVAESMRGDLALAVTEVCTNIIRHGYQGHSGSFQLNAARRGGEIRVTIEDQAPAFSPPSASQLPPPHALAEGGYGLALVEALVDEVSYEPLEQRGNRVTLVKRETGNR